MKKNKIVLKLKPKPNIKILNIFIFKKQNSSIKNLQELSIENIFSLSKLDKDFYFNKLESINSNKENVYLYIEVILNNSKKTESKIYYFDIENGSIKSIILNTLIPIKWNYKEFKKYLNPYKILSLYLLYRQKISNDI